MIDELKLKLCDIQGRLFELSRCRGYDSRAFIKSFMTSDVAKDLDSKYNRLQWAGEEYLIEEIPGIPNGKTFNGEVLYWIGYIYRYWHFYTGEYSAQIYKQASVDTMKRNYMIFHTMDPSLAVENLKEIFEQKKK